MPSVEIIQTIGAYSSKVTMAYSLTDSSPGIPSVNFITVCSSTSNYQDMESIIKVEGIPQRLNSFNKCKKLGIWWCLEERAKN